MGAADSPVGLGASSLRGIRDGRSREGAVGRDGKEPFGFKTIELHVIAATDPG
jgi:hypothetical protein